MSGGASFPCFRLAAGSARATRPASRWFLQRRPSLCASLPMRGSSRAARRPMARQPIGKELADGGERKRSWEQRRPGFLGTKPMPRLYQGRQIGRVSYQLSVVRLNN